MKEQNLHTSSGLYNMNLAMRPVVLQDFAYARSRLKTCYINNNTAYRNERIKEQI